MTTDGDQLAGQAGALRQARESLIAVLAGQPDWVALAVLNVTGVAAPSAERARLEQALSGVPAFVALKQVEDALTGIEAEIERAQQPALAADAPRPDAPALAAGPAPAATQAQLAPVRPLAAETPPAPPDDLTRIRGIDAAIKASLQAQGVTRFEQIAGWWPADVRRFGDALGVGRTIVRQSWVAQAELLMRQRTPGSPAATAPGSAAKPPDVADTRSNPATADASRQPEPAPHGRDAAALAGAKPGQPPAPAREQPAETLELKRAQHPETSKAVEPVVPLKLARIEEPARAQPTKLDVIDAIFSPAPADGADAAQMQLADPPPVKGEEPQSMLPSADPPEAPSPPPRDEDELAEIIALIRHSSTRGSPAAAQPAPKFQGLTERIEAVSDGAPGPASPTEPVCVVAAPTQDAQARPAPTQAERLPFGSLERLAALENAVEAIASADASANSCIPIPEPATVPRPMPGPAPQVHEAAATADEADVEIVRRPEPESAPRRARQSLEPQQEPPAFVGAEEASVVIVRRAAGEAPPALPFYAQKPPEAQSTVRRFMSALTGPGAKPPE